MVVTKYDVVNAINSLSLNNKCICVHSSLKSFGHVDGGAKTVVDAFLESGCTLLAPAFPLSFGIPPLVKIERNGLDYVNFGKEPINQRVFTTESNEITGCFMGAIPCEIIRDEKRKRGYHPLNSFVALGPMANELVSEQSEINVYLPFKKLRELEGFIILMGVNLDKMTAIHYAEQLAGRNLFIHWANDINGNPMKILVGGCSKGFNRLETILNKIEQKCLVGNSLWRVFPVNETISLCANEIKRNPEITHCPNPDCIQCNDIISGGPIIK